MTHSILRARGLIYILPIHIIPNEEPRIEPGGHMLRVGEMICCGPGDYAVDPGFDCLVAQERPTVAEERPTAVEKRPT
jgi:hypothetical protein